MDLVSLIILLVVVLLVLYIISLLAPDARIRNIGYAIVLVVVVVWLLRNYM
jgi:hypothetical protein